MNAGVRRFEAGATKDATKDAIRPQTSTLFRATEAARGIDDRRVILSHVWTAPCWQGIFWTVMQSWSVLPRPTT
jgi:hypothetical protein